MKRVDQTIIDRGCGDCTRDCVASLLEIEIDAVPNFTRFGSNYARVLWTFLSSVNYHPIGSGYPKGDMYPFGDILKDSPNVDGFVIASVPSKSFANINHSVIIDLNGLVVHDPNPNKAWQGINVLESGDLKHWFLLERNSE
mgnify:CR=1 FL=1